MTIDWNSAPLICDDLESRQPQASEIFTQISERWRLRTMGVLAAAGDPLRFSRLRERLVPVSQKSLTKTLRDLERDGLVKRVVFPEVPPRVEYSITSTGISMLEQVYPLWIWAVENMDKFKKARREYDER